MLIPWDPTDYIKTEEDIQAYMEAVEEENDPELTQISLDTIGKARKRWSINNAVSC